MAEALVVARRKTKADESDTKTLFVSLYRRPESILEAAEIAGAINRISDGADAGRVTVGDSPLGSFIRAPLRHGGCAALVQPDLGKFMMALYDGTLSLPQSKLGHPISMTRLGVVGDRGLLHRDICARGPFQRIPVSGVPTYPMLWAHDARRERHLTVKPDTEGLVREGHERAAKAVWTTATRLHFNLDFQLNSQSLAACLTRKATLGGSAWPNVKLHEAAWDAPVVLWANTTLGLMSFWWEGTRQQQGRARLTISALPALCVLDPRELSTEQIAVAESILKRFKRRSFLPANEAYRDPARKDLDDAVLVELLGLPEDILKPLETVRLQWCAEPSVHGGKGTRPTVWDEEQNSRGGP